MIKSVFLTEIGRLLLAKGERYKPTQEELTHWFDNWFRNFDDEVFAGACRGLELSTDRFSFPDLLARVNASPKAQEERQAARLNGPRCPKCDGVGYIISNDDGVSDPLKIHSDEHTRATRCRCEAGQRKSSRISLYADEYGIEPEDVFFHHYSETPEEGLQIAKDAMKFASEQRGRRSGEMKQAMEAER